MENKPTLQERVIASVKEADRLEAMIHPLERPETAIIALGLLPEWNEATRQAVHLCRLARLSLPQDALNDLIDSVNALSEECNLWEHYVIAEWYDEWIVE